VNEIAEQLRDLTGTEWTGWHIDQSKVRDTAVFATYRQDSYGRWIVAGLMVLAEDALSADRLREIPIDAIENSRNLSDKASEGFQAELAKLPPLKRTPDMEPEEFSRLVAEHYKTWARYVPHPAGAMAAEWKVKDPTMHTWIREARLRGFLPPARRGKGSA
jgi:hypothetical protein